MYLTYDDYTALGYFEVNAAYFPRYEAMAEQTVKRYTQNRITDDNITETNKRGVCEIIEVLYYDANPEKQTAQVASFSNGRYSESYHLGAAKTTDERVAGLISIYFTQAQLFRGIDK
ncbi:hypothetical protein AGMMS49975_22630 [Clostridia bacterium]|nr:hypothetical protein AGMMS49975_22630 [Clostridia bacterium]